MPFACFSVEFWLGDCFIFIDFDSPEAFTLVLLFNSYPLVKPEFQMVEEVLTLE